ncbi:uncharacterized protein LOC110726815 isoform X2 [Chenopodium quinoa]|uniref:Uncharacterized protein n=1 Tax=Chenopodium quinoa TaxID=63459 RepID=A0A803L220_CHEQI|nr:uncharacterized protein LOC110726815 isoform X2 [Chenopodium quinoa]
MDFQTFKRRDLQSLCKLNNIPANTTNSAMADALASLPIVEGLAEFLAKPDSETQGSPERSAINSSYAPRTTATRTRCSTRTRAVEGTDARKTPATRTTQKRASQETSIQKNMEKNMEAEFEAEKEQSEVTDNNLVHGEIKVISEVVSEVSMEIEGQSEPQKDVEQQVNDGQEVINLDAQEEATEMSNDSKVDFHSLSRRDLQTLCKRNKKPANTTNAAMAASLESLEIVEGLQELLMGCESQVPSSPLMSGITSSCARRSRTTMKISREEPPSSKLITKSCRVSRKRIVEETDQGKNDIAETPAAPSTQKKEGSAVQWDISSVEISEVSGVSENNGDENIGDISKSLTQEAPVNESTLQEESGKGNNDLLNVENLTDSSEIVAKVDNEIVVDDETQETLEVTEAVANFAIQDEDLKLGSANSELETITVQKSSKIESQDGQLENLASAPVSAAESLDENLATTHVEEQMSNEFVSESTTEADQVTLEINEDSNSGNTKLEKAVTFTFDSDVPEPAEDEDSEEFNTEFNSADKPSLETNVESEGSCTEDEMSEWSDYEMPEEDEVSDSELAIQDDLLSVEANVDSESEKSQLEKLDITTDSATDWAEKPEVSLAELLGNQFDTESTIQVRSRVPIESKTPLNHKSLRKLKRMYKEKLQEKTLVKGMEKLDLGETEVPLANVDEHLQEGNVEAQVSQVMLGSNEANEDNIEESDENSVNETGSEKDSVEEDVIQEILVINSVVETANLCPVDILLDNEVVSEEAVAGDIDVVPCPTLTPSKCSSMTKKPLSVSMVTPTKSACKTPMSAGRKNRVMDVNKENIDSISKTEPGKIKVAVTESGKILSALSMGMLKKEFKGLQQSEKKKKALQSRSDNQNLLASP